MKKLKKTCTEFSAGGGSKVRSCDGAVTCFNLVEDVCFSKPNHGYFNLRSAPEPEERKYIGKVQDL